MAESSAGGWPSYVGGYAIQSISALPEADKKFERDLEVPHLVQTAPAEKKIPRREVWDMAVLRLLKTKLPKMTSGSRRLLLELRVDTLRLGIGVGSDAYFELREKKISEGDAQLSDYSDISESALEISSHLGMLTYAGRPEFTPSAPGRARHESLIWWVRCADQIQAMFHAREVRHGLPGDLWSDAGALQIHLFYKPEGVSMRLLPEDTGSALVFHAAQMVTNGTKLLNCEYCNTPFLSGGEARGGGKRRRDARFCKDECRYEFHNTKRRKKKL